LDLLYPSKKYFLDAFWGELGKLTRKKLEENMSRLGAIGRAMENSFWQEELGRTKKFQKIIYRNTFQRVLAEVKFFFVKFFGLKKMAQKILKRDKKFLEAIKRYSGEMKGKYSDFEKYFRMWERNNCYGGSEYESSLATRMESETIKEIDRLNGEIRQLFAQTKTPYAKIKGRQQLVSAYNGHIDISAALTYWENLEKFFSKRVEELEKI